MFKKVCCTILVLVFCGGTLLAGDVTVVSYDAKTMKLVVKDGDKERTFTLKNNTHVHDVDGKEIAAKNRADKLKKDVKLELELEGDKLVEINIKK